MKSYNRQKHMIAAEAANIVIEKGIDIELARREACKKFGISDRKKIPKDQEIQALLRERSELFNYQGMKQDKELEQIRQTAVKAMQLFTEFRPKITGAILDGIYHHGSSIELHIFANTIEEVERKLIHSSVPFELNERKLKAGKNSWETFYLITFYAGDDKIEALIFLSDDPHRNILDSVSDAPLERLSLKQFMELGK
ncbi:MAG: hypothetical protein D6B28_01300 [Gammaproteobacteria bacterium]|nr:MAG: hypothetical protein D6B28_01300 [Gammaproteobacteria bacterium]